jgi:hypothetical protein
VLAGEFDRSYWCSGVSAVSSRGSLDRFEAGKFLYVTLLIPETSRPSDI